MILTLMTCAQAHVIRRQATTLYKTVSELSTHSRWCLTGTPVQNRLEDIGSLFAFIRAYPFDRMATFKRFIAVPFEQGGMTHTTLSERLRLLLDSLCLRRTKDLLHLPDQRYRTRILELSSEERRQYKQTTDIMSRAIRQNAERSNSNGRFGMFHVHLQLRLICNHGTFQHPFSWARKRDKRTEREAAVSAVGRNSEVNCSSCGQSMPIWGTNHMCRKYAETCNHVLCFECLDEKSHGQDSNIEISSMPSKCPICHPHSYLQDAAENDNGFSEVQESQKDYFQPGGNSSKLRALVADVLQDLNRTKRQAETNGTT